MPDHRLPPEKTRLGIHYYPDTVHYRHSDLQTWLPVLQSLGLSWLTLNTPLDRAIPEHFLAGLISQGIEPILRFPLSLDASLSGLDLQLLFSTYARWGINYIVLCDRPNRREAWAATSWAQDDLVERFLDHYIPAAQLAFDCGLTPVFPTLEPGGDYWDITFLRASLHGIRRRGRTDLLHSLVLSAIARAGERPLSWGAGGPERWPGVKPYHTPSNQQDQRGFRVFDWYLSTAQAITGKPVPIILFEAGSYPSLPASQPSAAQELSSHTRRNFAIAKALIDTSDKSRYVTKSDQDEPGPISEQILACNFWLLASDPQDPHQPQAWFQGDGHTLPIVGVLRQLFGSRRTMTHPPQPADQKREEEAGTLDSPQVAAQSHPIDHYLLLPLFEWGISDWYLDAIRPFVKKYHPTIGFSLQEAAHAARVTVVGSRHLFPDGKLDHLRAAGCVVERLEGDGTSIATKLASR